MTRMTLRIAAAIVLFISVFWLPFWLMALYALACLYFFDSFYEIIPAFLFIDLLYGAHEPRYFGFAFIGTFAAVIAVVGMRLFKKALRQ
jgi:hypothetical protein